MKLIALFLLTLASVLPGLAAAPPATPTEVILDLLGEDGSNIDTALLLTIDYTDGFGNPQSINSVNDPSVYWRVYNGRSNLYSFVSAKDGTGITVTISENRTDISIERYESVAVTAVEGGYAMGSYNLSWNSLRPTDTGGGADGIQHVLPKLYTSAGGNFVIHWTNGTDGGSPIDAPDLTDSNFTGTPDFIEDFASYFEASYAFITGRGFNALPSDSAEPDNSTGRNPNGSYDIFIYNMERYGYTNAEQYPNATSYSYIGVDNDYLGFPSNQDPEGSVKGAMKTTAAHSLFHAIQFTYDAMEEKWWMETTSTYMEDEVYPAVNRNYNYLPKWFEYSDLYGLGAINGMHEYGNFIFAKHMSEGFGDGVIRAVWEEMISADGLTAIDNVLASSGSGLIEEFRNFTMANFFLEDMYADGADYRAAILGNTTSFDGVWREYEYNETINGTPFTIDVGNVNYDAWMDTWAADYITLNMSGDTGGYAITFDGFDNSINYDVSLVNKSGGTITTRDFTLDAKKEGTLDLLNFTYTDVALIIRNSGSSSTTNPTWKVIIKDLFIPPGGTSTYTYTNNTIVTIPDDIGDIDCEIPNSSVWVYSEITVPPGDMGFISDLLVYVGIDHEWRGDLNVDLISPAGTTVRLHAESGDWRSNIYTWYDNESTPDGPGTLVDFAGEESNGTWKLGVQDDCVGDEGEIETWSLKLFVEKLLFVNLSSPSNTTYTSTQVDLKATANKEIDMWWYSLNSGANVTFSPNTTINAAEGLNNLSVYANDTSGNLSSSSVYFTVNTSRHFAMTYNISLIPGWNMISIPLEQDNWSIISVLASIEGNYTVVYAYIDGAWEKSTALINPLTDMALDRGYWINMSTSETLELNGTLPLSTTINVIPGWNLVGYPSFATQNITTVLSQVNYTDVYTYKNGMWYWDTSLLPFFVLTEMTTGQGYWINATAAGSYEVNNTEPTNYNISLIPGWNMISIPLEQDNWSITSVLASIEGNYTDIYAYVNGMWYWDTSLLPFFILTDMAIDRGYWINMSTAETLELNGTVPSTTTISVVPKWNLVGYPTFATQNITTVLSAVNYTVVYTYLNGAWEKSTAIQNPLTEMTVSQGYWVNATGAGSYDVNN